MESSAYLPSWPHNVVFVVERMLAEGWAEPRYTSGRRAFRPKTNGHHPSYFTPRQYASTVASYHANVGKLFADRRRGSLSGDGFGFKSRERGRRTPGRTRKPPLVNKEMGPY